MERGRRSRVAVIAAVLDPMPPDDLAAIERAVTALARSMEATQG
jgi:hypothetical protein